jgi:hypothetical protein
MLKAAELYPTRDLDSMYFEPPDGLEYVNIDSVSHLPATANCTETYTEIFLPGTVPGTYCTLHGSTISTIIEDGVGDAGRGIRRIFSGLGGLLGIGGSDQPSEAREEPSTSPR